jgi:hypothetical protein
MSLIPNVPALVGVFSTVETIVVPMNVPTGLRAYVHCPRSTDFNFEGIENECSRFLIFSAEPSKIMLLLIEIAPKAPSHCAPFTKRFNGDLIKIAKNVVFALLLKTAKKSFATKNIL